MGLCIEYLLQLYMYPMSAQGLDERTVNVCVNIIIIITQSLLSVKLPQTNIIIMITQSLLSDKLPQTNIIIIIIIFTSYHSIKLMTVTTPMTNLQPPNPHHADWRDIYVISFNKVDDCDDADIHDNDDADSDHNFLDKLFRMCQFVTEQVQWALSATLLPGSSACLQTPWCSEYHPSGGQRSFSYQAPAVWKPLPVSASHATYLYMFFRIFRETFLFSETLSAVPLLWDAGAIFKS